MTKKISSLNIFLSIVVLTFSPLFAQDSFSGFGLATWGMSPDDVKKSNNIVVWSQMTNQSFPAGSEITVFETKGTVAGYSATTRHYFWQNKYCQATVIFNFDKLKNFDFNYNVFRSVDQYYTAIHDQTLTFVADVYNLLTKKYGNRRPVFKGLDPRTMFKNLDSYIKQERWNYRYAPAEYYRHIASAAYARWDFQYTTVIFSLNMSAADKRFDYMLSLSSTQFEAAIINQNDNLRMKDF